MVIKLGSLVVACTAFLWAHFVEDLLQKLTIELFDWLSFLED